MAPQFVVGVDLGTTHCVMAFAALNEKPPRVTLMQIPQLTAPETMESLPMLPSFHYAATREEVAGGGLATPWSDPGYVVGQFARRRAAEAPDRTIGSAKSWLAHHAVDRRSSILPWGAPADVPTISPVETSKRYLLHLAAAWDAARPEALLADQVVVLTVPASFDASARELTREAALEAGWPADLVLLEEPQAAVYCWLHHCGEQWREQISAGDVVLVCDVGGGTTDLSLIEAANVQGELELRRRAVGNHLLVGGDNMDLALAHLTAEKLAAEKNVRLDPWQSVSLWHSCRAAKEALLGDQGPQQQAISIAGRGSRLVGGALSVLLDRQQVREFLLDGFFPICQATDRPQRGATVGFQEIGLPFESDAAITRHLAAFLDQHQEAASDEGVLHVLFNGGVFQSVALQQRVLTALGHWRGQQTVASLPGQRELNKAVALGAAYYGWSKLNGGVRVRGGTARAYYVGVESSGLAIPGAPRPLRALCVAPMGMEEGSRVDVPSKEIGLVVGQPAQFRFFASSVRQHDQPGDVLPRWSDDELEEIAPVTALLKLQGEVEHPVLPVCFQTKISELGMFELWCVHASSENQWKLEFSVRETGNAL